MKLREVGKKMLTLAQFFGSMLPQYMALFVHSFVRSFVSFVRFVQKKIRPLLSKVGG